MFFLLLVSVLFFANRYIHKRYTGNNLDIYDKGKLMLQVRQVISLVTSHPYLPFCRHIIPILNFISIENTLGVISFVNKVILVNQN